MTSTPVIYHRFTRADADEMSRLFREVFAQGDPPAVAVGLTASEFETLVRLQDDWVGGVLSFGEGDASAAIAVTNRDERCSMVNFDPDSARTTAEVLKAIVRVRDNRAGVYGAVTRRGRLTVGQPVFFELAAEHREHH